MKRIVVYLKDDELKALKSLAVIEVRDHRAQAALLIRDSLIQQGYLHLEEQTQIEQDNVIPEKDFLEDR